jgi:FixJ family two-component response regulator
MAAGKVIAVVDDDEVVREALAQLLVSFGLEAELYGSAEAFIEAAMKSQAACLVVDIQLGDITGIELGHHLSAMGLTFPIVFMTASDDQSHRRQAMELGCIAFLQKPIPTKQLEAALAEAVGCFSNRLGCC